MMQRTSVRSRVQQALQEDVQPAGPEPREGAVLVEERRAETQAHAKASSEAGRPPVALRSQESATLALDSRMAAMKAAVDTGFAAFLIQATFGPTRKDILEFFQIGSNQDWILHQMSLPAESHREYYRERVNPVTVASYQERSTYRSHSVLTPGSPCDKGSRWRLYAFTKTDINKPFRVDRTSILVAGSLRTAITAPPLATTWLALQGTSGYICDVVEGVGGDVQWDLNADCKNTRTMANPTVWMPPGTPNLNLSSVKKGMAVLRDPPRGCTLDRIADAGRSVFVQDGDRHYIFSRVFRLAENTPDNPERDYASCVAAHPLNEESCQKQEVAMNTEVQGLSMEVVEPEVIGKHIAEGAGGYVAANLIAREVFFPFAEVWHGFPHTLRKMAVRFKGELVIATPGHYRFWLMSDDGSRLLIDGAWLIQQSGDNNLRMGSAATELSAGRHNIMVDYYNNGDGGGLILSWRGPDSDNKRRVVPRSAFVSVGKGEPIAGCPVTCGSMGEVASNPDLGHQFAMFTDYRWAEADKTFDHRLSKMHPQSSKSTVWTMKALEAKDQLRQRTAWALFQMFLVYWDYTGDSHLTEIWLNYYDIFVWEAFGNYFDLLRKVTYSPIMGRHATYAGSESFDHSVHAPNEKYAGNLMQLLTVGPEKLYRDGTPETDANGRRLATYTTTNIEDVAKVFTGFANQDRRANVEYHGASNYIDPMVISVEKHDFYPKVGLDGAFIGDGYPLCNDAPRRVFLSKGAKYVYRPVASGNTTLVLQSDSQLLAELCKRQPCGSANVVTLDQELQCSGDECQAGTVRFVSAGGAYYEHIPKPCVYQYLPDPTPNHTTNQEPPSQPGWCRLLDGKAPPLMILDRLNTAVSSLARQRQCLKKCRELGLPACMLAQWGCFGVTTHAKLTIAKADDVLCWPTSDLAYGKLGYSYMLGELGGKSCPPGAEVKSLWECRVAMQYLGRSGLRMAYGRSDDAQWPTACSISNGHLFWNMMPTAYSHPGITPICRTYITVDAGGAVVPDDPNKRFNVHWLDGVPSPGIYPITLQTVPVYSAAHVGPLDKDVAIKLLRVGAYKPAGNCSICDGEVRAYYGSQGAMGVDTVFEIGDRYFKNSYSIVVLPDGKRAFRNPPTFLKEFWDPSSLDPSAQAAVTAEVDATLDHLFRHNNTPVFVAKQLIQRFGNSDPAPAYVEAVVGAFETGTYNNVTYGNRYGDLAATVAAILLHPEARSEGGSIREPMLKLIHLLRSMEYTDVDRSLVVFDSLQDVIGQFPFTIPSTSPDHADWKEKTTTAPDFEPPLRSPAGLPPSKQQGGRAPDNRFERATFGPTFEVLTPPYLMGYLNGVSNMLKYGVSDRCSRNKGLGIHSTFTLHGFVSYVCPTGHFQYVTNNMQYPLHHLLLELDILLTGGRLSKATSEIAQKAADSAGSGKKLLAATRVIAMSAEFNTFGPPLWQEGRRPGKSRMGGPRKEPYKAFIMLNLVGGADTWNMLVPSDCYLYNQYKRLRGDLAMEPAEFDTVRVHNQPCDYFGIHRALPFLKSLFDAGEAAFVTNVGNLVEPTTRQSYKSGSAELCYNLFAHADQQVGAQTLKCQVPGTAAKGVGGRIADTLANGALFYQTQSFSISGRSIWPMGTDTRRDILNEDGIKKFTEYEGYMPAIDNISAQRHGNQYASAWDDEFQNSIELTQALAPVLDAASLKTAFPLNTQLSRELAQVAKLIAAREARSAERDFFYVSLGGWDMHTNLKDRLAVAFYHVDSALRSFVAEMKAQNVWDQVVLASMSEFGRTLDSNGGGSDHGWAGQHFVIGGAVSGRKVLNNYPDSLFRADVGRGRLVPEYPWESMLMPIAEWLGMEDSNRFYVFPNLGKFSENYIIKKHRLFRT